MVEILFADRHVLPLGVFESTHNLVPGDGLFVFGAPANIFQPNAVSLVQQVETDVVRFGGGVKVHGDADHPEGNRASPDGSWGSRL